MELPCFFSLVLQSWKSTNGSPLKSTCIADTPKKESHQETKSPRAFALEFLFVQAVCYVVSVCLFAFHVQISPKES
jgi:hypothetical protein